MSGNAKKAIRPLVDHPDFRDWSPDTFKVMRLIYPDWDGNPKCIKQFLLDAKWSLEIPEDEIYQFLVANCKKLRESTGYLKGTVGDAMVMTFGGNGGSQVIGSAVVLGSRGESPMVLGQTVGRLTQAQYNVLKALLDAGDNGLTKDELDKRSGHTDARKILERLRGDLQWAKVVSMPGLPGGRYRVCQIAH